MYHHAAFLAGHLTRQEQADAAADGGFHPLAGALVAKEAGRLAHQGVQRQADLLAEEVLRGVSNLFRGDVRGFPARLGAVTRKAEGTIGSGLKVVLYCGIDLHARTMSLCILNQDGEILVHRNMPAGPAPFLKAVAPYREDVVVCVACIFPWYWLADLCARAGMPFVLGQALSMQAIHSGKAKIDSQNM